MGGGHYRWEWVSVDQRDGWAPRLTFDTVRATPGDADVVRRLGLTRSTGLPVDSFNGCTR